MDCLRTASSSDILSGIFAATAKQTEAFPWSPTLDGPGGLYPDLPSRLYAKGQFAKLPFITGANLDEGNKTISVPESEPNVFRLRNYFPTSDF